MSLFGPEYEVLAAWRAAQRCCDCGTDRDLYTTVSNSREVICRKCFADRANNRSNPNFGRLNP